MRARQKRRWEETERQRPSGWELRQFQEALPGLHLSQLDRIRQSLLVQLEQLRRDRLALQEQQLVRQLGLVVEWVAYRSVEASLRRSRIPVQVRHGTPTEDKEGLDLEIVIAGHSVRFDLTISEERLAVKWASPRRPKNVLPVKIGATWSLEGLAKALVREAILSLPASVRTSLSAGI